MTQLIIEKPITVLQLKEIAQQRFGDMVKVVVDVKKGIMAVGGELHADEEALLLDRGSQQSDLWGINIYVYQPRQSWIEYDSLINIRPSQGNNSRKVEDLKIQEKIRNIVNLLVV